MCPMLVRPLVASKLETMKDITQILLGYFSEKQELNKKQRRGRCNQATKKAHGFTNSM